MNTKDILEKLVAFDTVSRNSNMALMHYIQHLLGEADIQTTLIPNAEGTKANLLATIGPTDSGGVMLSGHTDVVLSKVKFGANRHLSLPVRTESILVEARRI